VNVTRARRAFLALDRLMERYPVLRDAAARTRLEKYLDVTREEPDRGEHGEAEDD
jgi:hypothetical protein